MCDTDEKLLSRKAKQLSASLFTDYREMVLQTKVNFVVIATPNSLHYEQAFHCIGTYFQTRK